MKEDWDLIIYPWLKSWDLKNIKSIPGGGVEFTVMGVRVQVTDALSNSMTNYYDVLNLETQEVVNVTGPEISKILYRWINNERS